MSGLACRRLGRDRTTFQNLHIHFVDAPGAASRSSKRIPAPRELRYEAPDPTPYRRRADGHPAFGHHLGQVTQAPPVGDIPADAEHEVSSSCLRYRKLGSRLRWRGMGATLRVAVPYLNSVLATDPPRSKREPRASARGSPHCRVPAATTSSALPARSATPLRLHGATGRQVSVTTVDSCAVVTSRGRCAATGAISAADPQRLFFADRWSPLVSRSSSRAPKSA